MTERLGGELIDASSNRGASVKKERTHTRWLRLIRPFLIIVGKQVLGDYCVTSIQFK